MTTAITGTATLTGHLSDSQMYKASYNKPIIGDMQWRVTADRNPMNWIDVGVVCLQKDNASEAWFCDAEIELTCVSARTGEQFSRKIEHCFKNGSMSCKVENFLTIPVNSNLKSFTVDAHITLKPYANLPTIPSTDFEIPQNTDDEIVLLVGDRKLYINKHLLMSHSTLFSEMLSSEDNEKKEIEIKDVKYEDMVDFLRFLKLEQLSLNDENVEDILKLAIIYDIQNLMVHCERSLIISKKIAIVEKLRLADKFKLEALQKEVIQNITKADIKKTLEDTKKYNFEAETKDALMLKMCTMDEDKQGIKPHHEKFYYEYKGLTPGELLTGFAAFFVIVSLTIFLVIMRIRNY